MKPMNEGENAMAQAQEDYRVEQERTDKQLGGIHDLIAQWLAREWPEVAYDAAAAYAHCAEELEAVLNNDGLTETARRHSADCRQQEQQRAREAEALQAGFELGQADAGIRPAPSELLLIAALRPFAPGAGDGVWGRIKAFVVNGAPTREEGIRIARQITEWQYAIPASAYTETEEK